ncbi:MAG: hypothetical protein N2255_03020, partial [Kiritimatiellae bacterium]|nr:hypothetical protein [Kiritimatiellia bacterium]
MNTLLPKRSSTELATAAALMLLMLVLPHRTQAAGTVSLNLVERSGVPRTGESLTAGVPIPRGMLQDVTNVRLLLNGKEVPAQFRALGHWWPDSSVRWLLVDTQVSIPAKGSAAYELQFGEEVACAGRPPQPIVVQTHDDRYVINTGPVTFVLNRKQFTLFEEVRIRSQVLVPSPSNQRPAAALRGLRAMVTRPIPHLKNTGHSHLIYVSPSQDVTDEEYELKFLTDVNYELIGKRSGPLGRGEFRKDFTSTNNKILIPRDAWLAYAQPRQGDIYTFRSIPAGASFEAEGVLESSVVESGPLRTVIRIKGCFGPIATPVMEFTAWYHFHAGSGRVKLVFTLENNNHGGRTDTGNANNANIGGINCVFFDSMSLVLPLAAVGDKSFTIGTNEGQPVEWKSGQHLELYQDSSGGPYWNRYKDPKYHPRPNSYVSFKGWKIFADDREVQCGDRATGWLSFSGNGCGLTVAIRDFWQNFPKSLGVHGNGVIEIGLFPGRYAGDFAFRSGEHKTHEILFCFHDIPPTPKESAALAVAFSDPLRLEPPALWFATT